MMTSENYRALFETLEINLQNPRIKRTLETDGYNIDLLQDAITSYLKNEDVVLNTANDELQKLIFEKTTRMVTASNNSDFKSYSHEFINNANYLIKNQPNDSKKISKEEFSERYYKLIEILKFENEDSNLTLETLFEKKPFSLFKNVNRNLVIKVATGKTHAISLDALIQIVYDNKKIDRKTYEPIIIAKILDNSIFNSFQNTKESNFSILLEKQDKIKQLEDDKLKILGKIQELEEKFQKREEEFDGINALYIESKDLKNNFDNAKSAVLEEFKLQKSYKFWEDQSKNYNCQYWLYVIFALVIAATLLICIFIFLSDNNLSISSVISCLTDNNQATKIETVIQKKEIWQYGFLILSITMTIWFIRILMKISLSNYHLSVDANERVVMIRTYLALIKEGKGFEQDDKKVILDNIFRPTNHGIIKDEASITITDILSALKSK